jgi:hypothetical protein
MGRPEHAIARQDRDNVRYGCGGGPIPYISEPHNL